MKKLIVCMVVVSVVILAGGSFLFIKHRNNKPKDQQAYSAISKDSSYAKAVQESFMEQCDADGTRTAYCACMYDSIVYHHGGVEAVGKYDLRKENINKMPQELLSDTEHCLDLQKRLENGL